MITVDIHVNSDKTSKVFAGDGGSASHVHVDRLGSRSQNAKVTLVRGVMS